MRTIRVAAAVGFVVATSMIGGTTPAAAGTQHCPDHQGHPGKVENVSGPSVTFDAGTSFCVKAGPYASGVIEDWPGGTWTTPLMWHPQGTQHIDISYYVVYQRPEIPDPETPDPEIPDPETPDPETPDPVTPDPVLPDPVEPEPDVEQLPPPGVSDLPATPGGVAEQVPAVAGQAPASQPLPHTGASGAIAALGAGLLALGVLIRRTARIH